MKSIKYISIALMLIFTIGITSCDLPDNQNPKAATEVPVNTLFTNALISFANQVNSSSVNSNPSRLLAQYWQETTYFDEARYNFQDRGISDSYSSAFYKDVIMDLKEAASIISATDATGSLAIENANKLAVMEVMSVYSFQCLVDAFGNIPYSEALMGSENSSPSYDDAATIYADLLSRISSAISSMDDSYGSFGSADILFGGDVASWKKFAASVKLRLGIRLADVDASAAKSAVESAYSAGVFEAGEGALFYYNGVVPHVNTIYSHFSVSNRKDWLPANTIVDKMNELGDPRIGKYFTQYEGEYIGAIYGLNGAQSYNNFSNFTDRFMAATFEADLLSYPEVAFILAEAAQRGWSVGGTAEDYFNSAVKASIVYWECTEAEADAYLAANAYDAANWKESIGVQKWIALYNQGVEAWAEWRRLDYPILNPPEDMTYADIPVRMPYPYDEEELNPDGYAAAVSAMGGDDMSIKLFWDKN
ncbi:SusD/RagB family nutrient-binding outer membrane lipoprotein [Draconibacterium sp. IB214405]|uniref:SusD/RagB family nutrient-binding outer membrane lipoprotein n=1 Tax=Draconibacterium sp. IB214405 TaxID=3097352 RepID=UPI002A0F2533|nr:SusD/RagB family nutrient-binding outer membrane lipoprotein [Draconibacterium sp. IB214405]MDX8340833.1 SusD/RagB family nutrient-binding outer membrane lipoprotein [Draconibacterium sp. IB214405]